MSRDRFPGVVGCHTSAGVFDSNTSLLAGRHRPFSVGESAGCLTQTPGPLDGGDACLVSRRRWGSLIRAPFAGTVARCAQAENRVRPSSISTGQSRPRYGGCLTQTPVANPFTGAPQPAGGRSRCLTEAPLQAHPQVSAGCGWRDACLTQTPEVSGGTSEALWIEGVFDSNTPFDPPSGVARNDLERWGCLTQTPPPRESSATAAGHSWKPGCLTQTSLNRSWPPAPNKPSRTA